jgi:sulfite dehydrogenase (quinone) subunit SoeC
MPLLRESPPDAMPDATVVDVRPSGYAEILLRVLAISGYGLWIWLGMGLALGMERIGRCDMRMPLILGTALVGAGLLLVRLRLPATSDWYGWPPGRSRWVSRAALMALVTFLPVLLVIILGDGHGHTPAMRLAGVALMLCSLVSLVYTAYRYRSRLSPGLQRVSSSLPVSRLVTAWYGGGLWLWLCMMVQGGLEPPQSAYPWILLLLALALLLGLLEGMRWQSLGVPRGAGRDMEVHDDVPPARFVAAIFIYVLPCAALLLTERFGGGLLAAAVAVPSCLLGKMLEQRVYETALAGELPAAG